MVPNRRDLWLVLTFAVVLVQFFVVKQQRTEKRQLDQRHRDHGPCSTARPEPRVHLRPDDGARSEPRTRGEHRVFQGQEGSVSVGRRDKEGQGSEQEAGRVGEALFVGGREPFARVAA